MATRGRPMARVRRVTRSVRRRLYRRLRRRGQFWQEPIISPYADKLRDRAYDGHVCRPYVVVLLPAPEPQWHQCPACGIERTDYEGPDLHLPTCPNCGSDADPVPARSLPPPAERPDGYRGKWPPVCERCGHRHAGAPCASHVWDDPCPYDAGADCDGVGLRPLPPLPVPAPRPPEPERGDCSSCSAWLMLIDGAIEQHTDPDYRVHRTCPGSGRPPARGEENRP